MSKINDCGPCKCSYEYLTLCEQVGSCVEVLYLYVTQPNAMFDVYVHNVSTKGQWRRGGIMSDAFGYLKIPTTRFINNVEGGKYEIRAQRFGAVDYACLEYDCQTAQALRFEVSNDTYLSEYNLNAPCKPTDIICDVVIYSTDTICDILIIDCIDPVCDAITYSI